MVNSNAVMTCLLAVLFVILQLGEVAQAGMFKHAQEEREVGEFHRIEAGGLVRVYLSPGEENSVLVKVRNIGFEDVITRTENGVLTISTKGNHRGESVKVYVSFKELDSLSVGGAATVDSDGLIETDEFYASTHGSGDIRFLSLKARRLDIDINNSGNARLDVDVDILDIEMHDFGDLKVTGRAGRQNVRSFGSRGTLKNSALRVPAL
jgi:hypothetical protein